MFDLVWLTKDGRFACLNREEWWRAGAVDSDRRDVYRAKVVRDAPALHGAFVSLGDRNALLRYDRGDKPLKTGETAPVTVVEPPKGDKLAVVGLRPTLGGEYLAYIPHGEGLRYAKGYADSAKEKWRQALEPDLTTLPGGWILRSAALGADPQAIRAEMRSLAATWREILQNPALGRVYHAPDEGERSIARDAREIWTDDEDLLQRLSHAYPLTPVRYVAGLTARYEREENALKPLWERTVTLDKGVKLTFDFTQAATVVDVDSGGFPLSGNPQASAREVNRVACKWLVRLLSLREITGVILVDFVSTDLLGREDLLAYLTDLSIVDSQLHVVDITRLGIVELTRQG